MPIATHFSFSAVDFPFPGAARQLFHFGCPRRSREETGAFRTNISKSGLQIMARRSLELNRAGAFGFLQ